MKALVGVGKCLVGLFWFGEVLNLFQVWPASVTTLYHFLSVVILGIHAFEAALASRLWGAQWVEPKYEKMQILVFGVFHLLALRDRQRQAVER
ncbi:MAG: DUF1145 domain-containing protein [Gammaproteobacteria bacterium]|nr:MAG: DUF1145 domain-containing protein [Gammaproteobacteria bacterium]